MLNKKVCKLIIVFIILTLLIIGGVWLFVVKTQPYEQKFSLQENSSHVTVSSGGNLIIPSSYKQCSTDSECVFVSNQCGDCDYTPMNKKFQQGYESQKKLSCENYSGDYCDTTIADNVIAKCIDNICTQFIAVSQPIGFLDINDPLSRYQGVIIVPDNIKDVVKGSVIEPPWTIRMHESAGYSFFTGETIAEFFLTSGGVFEWRETISDITSVKIDTIEYKTIKGTIPLNLVRSLFVQLEQAQPGPPAEDAGEIVFIWRDTSEQIKMVAYSMPEEPPASDFKSTIREIVQRYGQLE